jgi:small subunit ribosomal protein S35
LEDIQKDDKGEKPNKQSFWFDEEDPETNTEELEEFDEDDITSMAHGKLDEVREMRKYARLAVWELPLLSSKYSRVLKYTNTYTNTFNRVRQALRASH